MRTWVDEEPVTVPMVRWARPVALSMEDLTVEGFSLDIFELS